MKYLIIISILIQSCSSVGVTRVSVSPPKKSTCNLDIYTAGDQIPKPHTLLCLIDSRTGTTAFHDRDAAAAIRQSMPRACRCGADAIIIAGIDTNGATMTGWGEGKAIIKAIKYK